MNQINLDLSLPGIYGDRKEKLDIPAIGGPLILDGGTALPRIGRFNLRKKITHADLTEASADTDQVIALWTVPIGIYVADLIAVLITAFEDESDAALNDTKLQLGDGADPNRFVEAFQVNLNGTEVFHGPFLLNKPHLYTAADTIDLLVESMTAKSLVNIDKGEVVILANYYDALAEVVGV